MLEALIISKLKSHPKTYPSAPSPRPPQPFYFEFRRIEKLILERNMGQVHPSPPCGTATAMGEYFLSRRVSQKWNVCSHYFSVPLNTTTAYRLTPLCFLWAFSKIFNFLQGNCPWINYVFNANTLFWKQIYKILL